MPKRVDGIIRAFGMSGAQITADIEKVYRDYDLTSKSTKAKRQLENYDQFEAEVRKESSMMSEYYEIFYCLENSIRKLLSDTLLDAEGSDWWDTARVDPAVREEVRQREKKEIDGGITIRSDRHIDYTTFGELSVLINKNWDLFEPVFTSQRAVGRVLTQLNMLRNPIAHCCPISEDEKDRLQLAVKDWFRIIA